MDNTTLTDEFSIDQVELKGFSRSIAELEWLLLILVLLYFMAPGVTIDHRPDLIASMVAFAAFVIAFRYLNFYTRETRWKLAIETWVMIAFITWVLWNTGKIASPLLNAYILVIITSGLTLGKVVTLLEFALITACYLYMGYPIYSVSEFSLNDFADLMMKFSPFLLVAYLTTMLSADLRYARKMFKLLSETDDLTGLINLRAFSNILEKEHSISARYGRPYSLLMIDADGLKGVNDRYGHEAGNHFIKTISTAIADTLRSSDTLARYGGDEFLVLLPETDTPKAMEAAERIRTAVANTSFDLRGTRIAATVSVGIASYPDHADNATDLIEKADKAMYESKKAGRNRASVPATHDGAGV